MTVVNTAALIVLGIVMQIGGAYLVNAAVLCLQDTGAGVQYSAYMEAVRSFDTRTIVQAIVVMPLIEELVFRLIFLRAGKMIVPFWAANLIQATLFGIYHTVTIQKIYGFVLGLMIGCVFYYCPIIYRAKGGSQLLGLPNSLLGYGMTVILHITINAAGIYLAPLLPPDLPVTLQITMGTILLTMAGVACFVLYRQSSFAIRAEESS
ncbi:MAG: CPBP family intramembrane metalloprotease [Lachnospiraceae bacterium]|nr:CPBP family intramembrane metalloprotease [Lachnospiraceae bacterium]